MNPPSILQHLLSPQVLLSLPANRPSEPLPWSCPPTVTSLSPAPCASFSNTQTALPLAPFYSKDQMQPSGPTAEAFLPGTTSPALTPGWPKSLAGRRQGLHRVQFLHLVQPSQLFLLKNPYASFKTLLRGTKSVLSPQTPPSDWQLPLICHVSPAIREGGIAVPS